MPTQNAPCGEPAGKKSSPLLPSQPVSNIWYPKDNPQIMIQWTLSPHGHSLSGEPEYRAEVRMYQLVFDAKLPVPNDIHAPIPFSVTDPSNGVAPFLQGQLVLLQPGFKIPHEYGPDRSDSSGSKDLPSSKRYQHPILKVENLRFPSFYAPTLRLFPTPSIVEEETDEDTKY